MWNPCLHSVWALQFYVTAIVYGNIFSCRANLAAVTPAGAAICHINDI